MRWPGAVALAAAAAAAACSTASFKWHYRAPIEQGNPVDGDELEQLEIGMSAEQVRFVLGTPLAPSPFRPERWDYLYWRCSSDGQLLRVQLSLRFEDGQLARTVPPLDEVAVDLVPHPSKCR